MKSNFFVVLFFLIFSQIGIAGTFYSSSVGGDPNDLTKWFASNNNSGANPTNFTGNDVFVIQNGHTYITTNAWNVTGTVRVEGNLTIQTANTIKILYITSTGILTGTAQTTITAAASGGTFTIDSGGKYIFNNTTTNTATTLFAGTESFNANSNFEFQSFETTNDAYSLIRTASASNFGNVIWNIQAGATAYSLYPSNPGTTTICAGNFTVTKTGATGSLRCIRGGTGGTLTIGGDFTISDGTFDIFPAGSSSTNNFNIGGDLLISGTGIFELSSASANSTVNVNLSGDFTISGGTFRTTSNTGITATVYFSGTSTQLFTYSSGTFTTTNTDFNVKSAAILQLASTMTLLSGTTLTVASGGTLNIPNPYYTTGAGTTTIASGATLQTGHTDGISTIASTGCLQTTTKSCSTSATYEYNGTSRQFTGDINATNTTGNLKFNNNAGVRFNSDLIVANGGTLTLTQGYHNLNAYNLQLGTSASANTLTYTAGGLYSSSNDGSFTRYIPTATTITATSGNYYGLFPFSRSSNQVGIVKLSTSANVTSGGYITMVPTFGLDSRVACSVADGANTIVSVQEGSVFTISACTVVGGTSISMEYDGGTFQNIGSTSRYCIATYTNQAVGVLGTHSAAGGTVQKPYAFRVSIANMSSLAGVAFILGTYDTDTPLEYICDLGGTKTVGPTGNYADLTEAIDDLVSNGLVSSLVLELQATYVSTTEDFPLVFTQFACLGSSNTITIRPVSGATGLSISGSRNSSNGLLDFNGGDYITIDGRPGSLGSTSQLSITNTHSNSPVIAFRNDADYNAIKYATLKAGSTTVSEGAINFKGTSGTGTTGNKYDTISNCTITNSTSNTLYNGVYSAGQSGTKLNHTNFIQNNNIIDCLSSGVLVDGNSSLWTISDNHFYQTGSYTPSAAMYGIKINNTGSGYSISGNYIGGRAANCGGNAYTIGSSANHFFPMYLSTGSTSTTSIQGNVIRNIDFSTTSSGGTSDPGIFTAIYLTGAGSANIGTTSGNIIGDTTANASYDIKITSTAAVGLVQGISVYASGTVAIQNNLIGDFNTANVSGDGYTFRGIYTSNTSNNTISSNKIGSYSTPNSIVLGGTNTAAGVCEFYGIYNASSGTQTIESNTISNIYVYGTGATQMYGVYNGNGGVTTIESNTIKSFTNYIGTSNTAMTVGIFTQAPATTSVSSNLINTFTIANGFFKGIYLNNTAGTNTVNLNYIGTGALANIAISSLPSSSSAFTANVVSNNAGIVLGASSTISNVTYNYVRGITCSGASHVYRLAGIAVGNASSPAVSLTSNFIEKIGVNSATAAASIVYGIYSGSTATAVLVNQKNVIKNLFSANTSATTLVGWYDNAYNRSYINNFISVKNTDGTTSYNVNSIMYGIHTINASTATTAYFYYNTVELGGSVSSNPVTATIYQVSNTATTFIYNNNIFQNNCSSTNSLVFWGASLTPTCTMNNNFYMNSATGTGFSKVNGSNISSATFNSSSDDYGGLNSTYTTTALVINSDASLADMSLVFTGANLSGNVDCRADINGTVGNRNIASTNVYKGCYEGGVSVYYWVGGSGNWSDYSNHWAYSSGGAPIATAAPTSSISVLFDQNSGTGTTTINATSNCLNLTASGFTGTVSGSSTLNVYGNFTAVTGMTWSASGTINLLATSTGKTFSSGGIPITSAVTLNGSGSEYTLQNNTEISGAVTLTNGVLIVGANTLTLSSNSSPTRTSGYISAYGANSTVAFSNTSTEIIIPSGLFYEDSVRNLTMNGSGGIQLSSDFTVTKVLTLTNGNIDLGTYDLIIDDNGYATGYSSSSYVMTESTGALTQNNISSTSVTGKTFFPVGHTIASYTPCIVVNIGTADDFSLRILSDHYADGTSGTTATTDKIDRTWLLEEAVVGGSDVTMTIQWNTAEELTGFDRTNCFLSHYTSGAWDSESATSASGSNPWTLSRSGITSFSPFSPDEGSALPIELVSFDAIQKGNYVSLDWVTASEYNNNFFTVERSENGRNFESLFTKKSQGNTSQISYYHGLDKLHYEGVSYYRLKQTDIDGKYAFSSIQSVKFNTKLDDAEVNVYPNPTTDGSIVIAFESKQATESEIVIIDPTGKVIYENTINVYKGKNVTKVQLPSSIPIGMYIVELKHGDEGVIMHTFIKN
jgi:hypothetical protein